MASLADYILWHGVLAASAELEGWWEGNLLPSFDLLPLSRFLLLSDFSRGRNASETPWKRLPTSYEEDNSLCYSLSLVAGIPLSASILTTGLVCTFYTTLVSTEILNLRYNLTNVLCYLSCYGVEGVRVMQCLCFCCHPFRAGLSPEVNLTFLLADISSVLNKLLKNYFNSEPRLTNSLRCS